MITKHLKITEFACVFLFLISLVSCGAETSTTITDDKAVTSKTSGNDSDLPVEETNWLDMFECEFSSATMNCTITKYIGKETTVVVPEKINGYTVKAIGDRAFIETDIATVNLPDTVVSIGREAFYNCARLKELKLPEGLETIPSQMCRGCSLLNAVKLPDSLISIGHGAFYGSTFVDIGSKLDLPDNIKYVGLDAFATNHNSNNLIYLNYGQDGDFIIVGDGYLYKYQGNEKNVVIPDRVKTIGDFSFIGNKNVESVVIPDGVERICWTAFGGCINLSQVTMPDSVTTIEDSAFSGTSSLKQLHFPKNLKTIEQCAFTGSGLTSIDLSESKQLTYIGKSAFMGCDSLSEIVIYEGAEQTNFWAFYPAYKNNAKITIITYEAD